MPTTAVIPANPTKVLKQIRTAKRSTQAYKDQTELDTQDTPINYDILKQQIRREKKIAETYMKPKWDEWRIRLSLYHNARRDKEATGDPLMFTLIQTMLAALYDDRPTVEFGGREEGDEETAENLNAVAEYDYDEMDKASIDLDWDWDTLFFGRGLVMLYEFERDAKNKAFVPLPQVIDPLTFLRDPHATSVNGDARGRGALRFGGIMLSMTKGDMRKNGNYTNLDALQTRQQLDNIKNQSERARDAAQGRQNDAELVDDGDLGDNTEYDVLFWMTHYQGKKVFCWLANDEELEIRYQVNEYDRWPIIDKPLYPLAHDWDGVSIPDLTEDKQRARAIAQNLGLKMMKADLYPMYLYNEQKIQNKADLNFDFNKFIPSKGDVNGAIAPVNKVSPNLQFLNYIFEVLDTAAQKATATPEIQQGVVANEKRTLGEINLVAAKADTRYALAARIFAIAEKQFWQQWYHIYKEHFEQDIDEKMIRIAGPFGQEWRGLDKENMIAAIDPDIKIESRVLAEQRRQRDMQILMQFMNIMSQAPGANLRYGLKKLGKLSGFKKDEIDRLLPPTIDEMMAEYENVSLNENKYVQVQATDNHEVHLEYHGKAQQTPHMLAHITVHKEALRIKQATPAIMPGAQPGAADATQGAAPNQAPALNKGVPGTDQNAPTSTAVIPNSLGGQLNG